MKVCEMQVGTAVSARLVVAAADVRQTKTKKDYLQITFTDGTDSISGNIWDFAGPIPERRTIYDVGAIVGEYNGQKQLNNITITKSSDQDMSEFNCAFIDDPTEVYNKCMQLIGSIEDTYLQTICIRIYHDLKDSIIRATSAKAVHHVGSGGNVVHTWEVTCLSRSITETLRSARSLPINTDLVTAGALLHDIGKPFTLSIEGPVIEMTNCGLMHDHIIAGITVINKYCADLHKQLESDEAKQHVMDLQRLLVHMIASHHGEYEHGSPVTPKCMEAYVVHYADMISATLEILRAANQKAEELGKERTERIFVLSNSEHILQSTVDEMMSQS